MSGIVGIVNFDGAPVDAVLLREMTQHMAFRGPDAQETWIGSHVGLGHAMLRTTFEMAVEQQPRTLDGRVWITADARIDAREELIHKLKANACAELAHVTDTDLISMPTGFGARIASITCSATLPLRFGTPRDSVYSVRGIISVFAHSITPGSADV